MKKRIYHHPFIIEIKEELKDSGIELANELITYLLYFGNVYVRQKPEVDTFTDFATGEKKTVLSMRIGLEPIDCQGEIIATMTNPHERNYENGQISKR